MSAGRPCLMNEAVRTAFDRCLAQADETAAVRLVLDLAEQGADPEAVLLDLIAPAQYAVGARWAANEWSVAQEHAATHVSDRAVAALAAAVRPAPPRPGSVVVACPDGEWHTLPGRLVAEVLRLRGFTVRFLGAHVPTAHLVSYLHQNGPDLVALSSMLALRLPQLGRTIQACRLAGVPVLAGGAGFGPDGSWARVLGADLYAADAAEAADLLARRWPPALAAGPPPDHPQDGEYRRLADRRVELLHTMTDHLDRSFPPMRGYDERQREATAEDLCFLLDFLAAGVYVDDPRVVTEYLEFAADVLAARRVPPASLHLALQALPGPLTDLPRTAGQVAAGQRWLEQAGYGWQES